MMRKRTTGSRLPQGRRDSMYHLVSLITTERVESKREASLSPQPLSERGANIKKSRKPNLHAKPKPSEQLLRGVGASGRAVRVRTHHRCRW